MAADYEFDLDENGVRGENVRKKNTLLIEKLEASLSIRVSC
ncbi:hypothetical protein [Clostridium omnivorum]|nr:hypothetical protein [Clostridium sp. E14]